MEDLKWFAGFIIFFVVAWFMSGGILRDVKTPFIASPIQTENSAPVKSSGAKTTQKTGELYKDLRAVEVQKGASALEGQLELSTGSYGATTAASEYVVIKLSDSAPSRVLLTGMSLKSNSSGRTAEIGKGAYLPQQATINAEEPVYLEPGATAYIITGRSPTGYSFRVNKCIGYFAQFQRWTPSLPIQCPYPKQEPMPPAPNSLPDSCLEYIDNMSRCKIVASPPDELSPECRNFIRDSFTYPKCITSHKSDSDFYKNEWRVYLSRDLTLWKSTREVISLLDPSGKVIDTITY